MMLVTYKTRSTRKHEQLIQAFLNLFHAEGDYATSNWRVVDGLLEISVHPCELPKFQAVVSALKITTSSIMYQEL